MKSGTRRVKPSATKSKTTMENPNATPKPETPAELSCTELLGCLCWSETNACLKEKGYKLADVCSMLTVTDELGLHATRGVPLERADGARLKRDDPRMLQVSYCCFCGKKYPNGKAS